MAIAYRYDADRRLAISVWDGAVSSIDVSQHLVRLGTDLDWPGSTTLLSDLSTITERPTLEDVRDAADLFGRRLAGRVCDARWAIVARKAWPEAMRFEGFARRHVPDVAVFADLDDSCTWLGIDSREIRTLVDDVRAELPARSG